MNSRPWPLLAVCLTAGVAFAQTLPGAVLFEDKFDYPNGLLSNEFAAENPTNPSRRETPNWEVTAGSLFAINGTGSTGIPDRGEPDALSKTFTDSCVFRCRTKTANFGDVEFSLDVFNKEFVSTEKTPDKSYDGIHLWLRYASDKQLYSVTVNRRDNIAVLKKKVPGGPSNGGTYTTLKSVKYPFKFNEWQHFTASAKNNGDGSVTIGLTGNGTPILSFVDTGKGGPPLLEPGRVGIRGDNCHFQFDNVIVRSLN